MANIVITSCGTNGVCVDFGTYKDVSNGLFSPQGFNANNITHVYDDDTAVEVICEGRDSQRWYLSHNAVGGKYMQVDSVDGVAPTSASDLVAKITALM